MSEIMRPETLSVINDQGVEEEIPQADFWQYEWDAQPNAITFEEWIEQEGAQNG